MKKILISAFLLIFSVSFTEAYLGDSQFFIGKVLVKQYSKDRSIYLLEQDDGKLTQLLSTKLHLQIRELALKGAKVKLLGKKYTNSFSRRYAGIFVQQIFNLSEEKVAYRGDSTTSNMEKVLIYSYLSLSKNEDKFYNARKIFPGKNVRKIYFEANKYKNNYAFLNKMTYFLQSAIGRKLHLKVCDLKTGKESYAFLRKKLSNEIADITDEKILRSLKSFGTDIFTKTNSKNKNVPDFSLFELSQNKFVKDFLQNLIDSKRELKYFGNIFEKLSKITEIRDREEIFLFLYKNQNIFFEMNTIFSENPNLRDSEIVEIVLAKALNIALEKNYVQICKKNIFEDSPKEKEIFKDFDFGKFIKTSFSKDFITKKEGNLILTYPQNFTTFSFKNKENELFHKILYKKIANKKMSLEIKISPKKPDFLKCEKISDIRMFSISGKKFSCEEKIIYSLEKSKKFGGKYLTISYFKFFENHKGKFNLKNFFDKIISKFEAK